MLYEKIKNNIFLYLLSLSSTINYIFYFPFIILYLLEIDILKRIEFIKISIYFIIYDLIRNIFITSLKRIAYCIGINRKLSIDFFFLSLISISQLYVFYRFEEQSFFLNIIIILRIILSLTNISDLFRSKIIGNLYERKDKVKNFDFYEKINNFLIFLFIFFFINSLKKMYLYFFLSSLFNLFFFIIYILIFRCHDEKIYSFYEEQELNRKQNLYKSKKYYIKNNLEIKTSSRMKSAKVPYSLGVVNYLKKQSNKDTFYNKYKKTSSVIAINNDKKKFNNIGKKNINDIDNNEIILSTNSNQINTNKELSNNNDKIKNKNKDILIINNTPIVSSNRSSREELKIRNTFTETKNENLLYKKRWIFILFILIPSKFLKYLFLFMLFIKTNSYKNVFKIKIHLLFYCCYFLMNILLYPLNKKIFSIILNTKNGKKKLYISSIIFSFPACIGYIYLILDNSNNNDKFQLEKYIIFFISNFILKECLYFLLRIYYIKTISIGFTEEISKKMKEISNILTCFLFLGYNILLLLIRNDTITYKIIRYILYYFLPLIFMLFFFINTINIS